MSTLLRTSIVLLAGAGVFASACSKSPEPAPASAPVSSAAEATKQSSPLPAPDPKLMETLQTMAKTCRAVPGEARVNCGQGAQWQLVGAFIGDKQARDSAAVATLALGLTDPDPGMSGLSATLLRSAFGAPWGKVKTPPKIEAAAADALLAAVLAQQPGIAKQTMAAAVNAAMLAGRAEHLYAELDRPEHAALREAAYPYVLTFGRLAQLPKVEQLVKDPALPVALAALEAPLYMTGWTEAEAKPICDFAQGLLADARPPVSKQAALVLASCSGPWIDALLQYSEKVLASKALEIKDLPPLAGVCKGNDPGKPERVTEKQCGRARKLLDSVAKSSQVDAAISKEARKLADAASPQSAAPAPG